MKILVTGATGFIGQHLVDVLRQNHDLYTVGRRVPKNIVDSKHIKIDLSEPNSVITLDLSIFDTVIHCAAATTDAVSEHDEQLLWNINTKSTELLAVHAKKCGVKKFIFLSSSKIYGESSKECGQFKIDAPYAPSDSYAKSKMVAEKSLLDIFSDKLHCLNIVRVPPVYGRGAKGNVAILMKLVNMGIPLPFGRFKAAKRSYISVENLVSFIEALLSISDNDLGVPIFNVSDNADLSIVDVVKLLGSACGKQPRLMNISPKIMEFLLNLLGKKDMYMKMCTPCSLDTESGSALVDWVASPPDIEFKKYVLPLRKWS